MTTQAHYESHTASSYESAFFYSPGDYTNFLVQKVKERLGLGSKSRTLLDVGGGTGNFTRLLIDNTNAQAVVVDPFLEAVPQFNTNLRFVKAKAKELSAKSDSVDIEYHQVLMKEVVHHFNKDDRVDIFRGIREGLSKTPATRQPKCDPSLLIITRPRKDIDYPLWKEAREVWASNQPPLQELTNDLRQAGFLVEHTIESYPCETSLQIWCDMVKGRFWSTFSNFTDAELDEACRTIERNETHRVSSDGKIHFEDRLLFISAYST